MASVQRIAAGCLVAALLPCGQAQASTSPALPTGSHIQPLDALPQHAVYAVATRLDQVGRIVAPVYINGLGPLRFMLDTGANHTALAEGAAQRLGLPDGGRNVAIQGVNGLSTAHTVLVQQLAAGELSYDEVSMPVLDGLVLDGLDGILGMDALAGRKLVANFNDDTVRITDSDGRRAPLNRIVIPVRLLGRQLAMVDSTIGRVRVKAVIDTGSARTLGNLALQRALQSSRSPTQVARATSVVDAGALEHAGEAFWSPPLKLGGATIRDATVTFGDFDIFRVWQLDTTPAVLIGMDVLGTLEEIAIDYRRQELQLLPRSR
jgi:predicted aspartyl protease